MWQAYFPNKHGAEIKICSVNFLFQKTIQLTTKSLCSMIILTDKLGFRSRPFRMFRGDFMYTIGQVSQMCGIPVSTLRYYDKEGLFPHMERVSGIRRFSDRELETLRIIECLKKSGLEIREIRKFMQWCAEGSSSYPQRRELFENQKKTVEKEIERLQKALDMLRFKCWYYDTAIADGNEDRINEMLPNNLPEDIQKLYDHAHSDDED